MAKKKRVEEQFDFVPPEFNEKEFIENDLADSKVVIITTVFGIAVGAAAAAATIYVSGIVGFLIIVLMAYGLFRLLFRLLKVDLSKYKRKDYIYKGGTYFITALAIWILLLNPPFAFTTPPSFKGPDAVAMYQHSGSTWQRVQLNTTPTISAGEVNITAHILSIGDVSATLFVTHGSATFSTAMNPVSGSDFSYITNVTSGSYSFYILAKSGGSQQTRSSTYDFSVA